MRSTTAAQLSALAASGRSTHVRVFVDRTGTGTYADLTSQGGVDWVTSVSIDHQIDAMASTCQVRLAREGGGESIATFMEGADLNLIPGTYTPLIDVGRAIYIEACVLAEGATPTSTDWVEVFRGIIDELDFASEVVLRCRDQYYRLADSFIESIATYGSAAGTNVEDVIQSLLDDNLGASVVTLYSPNGTSGTPFNAGDSPGFAIKLYEQRQERLSEAIDALVRLIGYQCRYVWHANTSAYQLVLYEPDRAKTTPDHTFDSDDYSSIDRLSISRIGIRNRIQVDYTDALTALRKTVLVTDSTSIARYGTLFMRIGEAGASQIDTSAEATAFATAVRDDLKSPVAEQSTEQRFFWPAQLGDLYRYTANGKHYDTDQDLALVGINHRFSDGRGQSNFVTRGSPSGGYKRWLRLDAQDQPIIGNAAIGTYHENQEMQRNAINANPNFGVYTFDADVNPPDSWSVETAGTAGDVATTRAWGDTGGDGWNWYFNTSNMLSGGIGLHCSSLSATAGASADAWESEFLGDLFLVPEGRFVRTDFAWLHDGTGSNETPFIIWLDWFDENKAALSSPATTALGSTRVNYSTTTPPTQTASTWTQDRGWAEVPAGARYARIRIQFYYLVTALNTKNFPNVYFDHFVVSRSPIYFLYSGGSTNRSISASTWTRAWMDGTPTVDAGLGFTQGSPGIALEGYWEAPYDFEGDIYARIRLQAMGAASKTVQFRILKNGSLYYSGIYYSPSGSAPDVYLEASWTGSLSAGDQISAEVWHNDGSAKTFYEGDFFMRITEGGSQA